ncbi:MAG: DNA-binding protein [Armatimonadetes bacterium]|nr:DNA-binding protein [Armatimonadota bacterium]
MQYAEGRVGRVFALRLEHGERMPEALEAFLADHGITRGIAVMVGGADDSSRFVVGPRDGEKLPPEPMVALLRGVHEAAAVGTIFPNESGEPKLHMHAAFGRGEETRSGCIRAGIVAWHILEIVVLEITGMSGVRVMDPTTGFGLLQFPQTEQ